MSISKISFLLQIVTSSTDSAEYFALLQVNSSLIHPLYILPWSHILANSAGLFLFKQKNKPVKNTSLRTAIDFYVSVRFTHFNFFFPVFTNVGPLLTIFKYKLEFSTITLDRRDPFILIDVVVAQAVDVIWKDKLFRISFVYCKVW